MIFGCFFIADCLPDVTSGDFCFRDGPGQSTFFIHSLIPRSMNGYQIPEALDALLEEQARHFGSWSQREFPLGVVHLSDLEMLARYSMKSAVDSELRAELSRRGRDDDRWYKAVFKAIIPGQAKVRAEISSLVYIGSMGNSFSLGDYGRSCPALLEERSVRSALSVLPLAVQEFVRLSEKTKKVGRLITLH